MAGDVDHQAAPCKARFVVDTGSPQHVAIWLAYNKLQQRLESANRAYDTIGFQRRMSLINLQ